MDLKRHADSPCVFLLVVIAGGAAAAAFTIQAIHYVRDALGSAGLEQWALYAVVGALVAGGIALVTRWVHRHIGHGEVRHTPAPH